MSRMELVKRTAFVHFGQYNPLRNMSYKHFLIPPLLVGARYGCADFFVQNLDSAGKLQIHRTVRYAFWGFAQMSVFNPLYMLVYPMIFGKLGRLRPLISAAFDVCITMPCLYFPGFYFVQNSMNGNLPLFEKTQSLYKQNIKNDAIKCGTIWFPIHLINFSIVPAAYRGYFSACAGFIWAAYLSYMKQ